MRTTLSPVDTLIHAIYPLPAVPPYTVVLALYSSRTGTSLAHIDLAAETFSVLGDTLTMEGLPRSSGVSLVVSQGALRGKMGLVAVIEEESGARLCVAPRLERK